jgi:hypothetical protein
LIFKREKAWGSAAKINLFASALSAGEFDSHSLLITHLSSPLASTFMSVSDTSSICDIIFRKYRK